MNNTNTQAPPRPSKGILKECAVELGISPSTFLRRYYNGQPDAIMMVAVKEKALREQRRKARKQLERALQEPA